MYTTGRVSGPSQFVGKHLSDRLSTSASAMEQSILVHRSFTLFSGSCDPLLARHCSYSCVHVIEQPVSIHMLCICFFELGYVFMTLSLFAWFAKEYTQFIVIMYLVQQFRIWHNQNGLAILFIDSICTFIFNCVWFFSICVAICMWHDLSLHWILTVLILGSTKSKMYRSMFIMNKNQLPNTGCRKWSRCMLSLLLTSKDVFQAVFLVAINNNFD